MVLSEMNLSQHHKPYPAINPTRPELSLSAKTVFITGGGRGIGVAVAESFAQAKAKHIVLFGRKLDTLKAVRAKIEDSSYYCSDATRIHVFSVDITDSLGVEKAFKAATESVGGGIDILVHGAGYCTYPVPTETMDRGDFARTFEVNTMGSLYVLRAFLSVAAAANATIIYMSAVVSWVPPFPLFPSAAYPASKAATDKIIQYLATQRPDLDIFSVHPGLVETDMLMQIGFDREAHGEMLDDAALPGNFCVWLASPEAKFLRGKVLMANWDVEEMKQHAAAIAADPTVFTVGMRGFAPSS